MGDETTNAETVGRETAADRLEDIASALRNDDDLRVRVGNKEITLHPTDSLDYRIRVVEKRPGSAAGAKPSRSNSTGAPTESSV